MARILEREIPGSVNLPVCGGLGSGSVCLQDGAMPLGLVNLASNPRSFFNGAVV